MSEIIKILLSSFGLFVSFNDNPREILTTLFISIFKVFCSDVAVSFCQLKMDSWIDILVILRIQGPYKMLRVHWNFLPLSPPVENFHFGFFQLAGFVVTWNGKKKILFTELGKIKLFLWGEIW